MIDTSKAVSPNPSQELPMEQVSRELVERLRSYATALDALRVGVGLDESQRLANVTPALAAKAMSEAADLIEALSPLEAMEVTELRNTLKRLFEASKRHDPDDWDGEPAMIEAAQVLGEPPFSKRKA